MKRTLLSVCLIILAVNLFGKITFGPSDLNKSDEVLFTLSQEMAGVNTYRSLFYAKIVNGESSKQPELLTCYPEQMELINGSKQLQIRNRYGTGVYDIEKGAFSWSNTVSEIPTNALPLTPYSVSPDGNYLCKIVKDTLTSGTLILQNIKTGKFAEIGDDVRQNYEYIPVKWSPDSSLLIYEKDENLYFCNPDAILRGVEMDEKYRKIGRGTINSINWATDRIIIYIDDYLVYQINAKELYTIGLYSGIIGQGKAIGRLPSQYNARTDRFSVNKDVTSLFLIQNTRLFSYLRFQNKNCDYMDVVYSKPYIDPSASLVSSYVFWDKNGEPNLWLEKLPFNGSREKGEVSKITTKSTTVLEIADSGRPIVSPDNSKAAFYAASSIYVYDTNTWQRLAELSGEKVTSAIWGSNSILYVGGEKTIKKWNLLSNTYEVIMLSAVDTAFWTEEDKTIVADAGGNNYYKFLRETSTWQKTQSAEEKLENENGRYRIFTGATPNKLFENALYIRTLNKKAVTKPMYRQSVKKQPERKKIALVFDAYDNSDGLTKIIAVLQKYNVPATFFINGEFVRRYPAETRQIAYNGYQTGAMFFSMTDLVNNPFIIDESFIRRGLARNEDEYYECTGKELSLYWHAPYYSVEPKVIMYGEAAGYTYVNSYQTQNDTALLDRETKPETLIYAYCETLKKTNGGIVPVSVGFSQGNRTDPLYNYLDILICALIDSGFEFVTVNDL